MPCSALPEGLQTAWLLCPFRGPEIPQLWLFDPTENPNNCVTRWLNPALGKQGWPRSSRRAPVTGILVGFPFYDLFLTALTTTLSCSQPCPSCPCNLVTNTWLFRRALPLPVKGGLFLLPTHLPLSTSSTSIFFPFGWLRASSSAFLLRSRNFHVARGERVSPTSLLQPRHWFI